MAVDRKSTKFIVIHCSASRPSMDVGRKEIDAWHKARGFSGVGYHFIVRRDGTVEKGRPKMAIGAHAAGYNNNSLAVCWVGGVSEDMLGAEDNRTPKQKKALEKLVLDLHVEFPDARILGHRDLPNVNKACPSFDVAKWLKEIGL